MTVRTIGPMGSDTRDRVPRPCPTGKPHHARRGLAVLLEALNLSVRGSRFEQLHAVLECFGGDGLLVDVQCRCYGLVAQQSLCDRIVTVGRFDDIGARPTSARI